MSVVIGFFYDKSPTGISNAAVAFQKSSCVLLHSNSRAIRKDQFSVPDLIIQKLTINISAGNCAGHDLIRQSTCSTGSKSFNKYNTQTSLLRPVPSYSPAGCDVHIWIYIANIFAIEKLHEDRRTSLDAARKDLHCSTMNARPQLVVWHELSVHIPAGLGPNGFHMNCQSIRHTHKWQLVLPVNTYVQRTASATLISMTVFLHTAS